MSLIPFEPPSWIKDVSAKTIEENMMKNLPLDIDKTEGGIAWDLTYPTALEKSEMLQFYMIQTLKTMFPMWAEGKWLDYHAQDCGLTRRAANKSYGTVKVTGITGTVIPKGFIFCVPADSDVAAIDFETLAEATIPASKTIEIEVQAVVAGKHTNVASDTITIMRNPMRGITNITNDEAITGGAEEEDDESLRQRIDEYLAGSSDSYVGNNADYVRWAKEVPGVGFAHTIPAYNGPNSVKVVVVDTEGLPANTQILNAVHLHIWGTDKKDLARLAPVGVTDFSVVAPTPVTITYSFKLKLTPGATEETVITNYKTALQKYYASVADDGSGPKPVQYVMVAAILAQNVVGVADFKEFLMDNGETNITFEEDEYPVTGTIEVETYE